MEQRVKKVTELSEENLYETWKKSLNAGRLLFKWVRKRRIKKEWLNEPDRAGHTPLMLCIRTCNFKGLCLLIQEGADVNQLSSRGDSCLAFAIQRLSVIFKSEEHEKTKRSIIHKLLKSGARKDQMNERHESMLMLMVRYGNDQDVEEWVNSEIPLHEKDLDGMNALMIAAWRGDFQKVRILMKAGLDWKTKDVYGNNVLMYSVRSDRNYNKEGLMFWLEMGCDPYERNVKGVSAWDMAEAMRSCEARDILQQWQEKKRLNEVLREENSGQKMKKIRL